MRRVLSVLLTLGCVSLLAAPAFAAPREVNPPQFCTDRYEPLENPVTGITLDQYVLPVQFTFGGETAVEEFGLSSFEACVSTVAAGYRNGVVLASAISKPAYLAQCDFLEAVGAISYPHDFYGTYPAQNRADCARILQGVHSGKLELPGPPPVG